MADLINEKDSLNNGRKKLNNAITDSENAKNMANDADTKATQALDNSNSTQDQLNQVVIEGDSSVEAAQARVDEKGVSHTTLKDRIDDGFEKTTSQLAQTALKIDHIVNVSDFGVVNTSTTTDQTQGIQDAIDHVASLGGGTVQFNNATYYAQGLTPKNNVTLLGTTGRTRLKLSVNPTNHLIYYNDLSTVENFNLIGIEFDGNSQISYDLVHISEPDPVAPKKTWYMSVVDRCRFINGRIGINCPVPGSVKILNSYIAFNDIGIKQLQEHFYITNTVIWKNRIGADIYRANHFTWTNAVFAHNTEAGVTGMEFQFPDTAFENNFNGCVFIDNGEYALKGSYRLSRFIGCRFLQHTNGAIERLYDENNIIGCQFRNNGGISVFSAGSNNIVGNFFKGNDIAIDSNAASKDSISNNQYEDNTVDIIARGSDTVISGGNKFRNTKQNAIIVRPDNTSAGYGINIDSNHFLDGSKEQDGVYSFIVVDDYLIASSISSNTFRSSSGETKSKHAIETLKGGYSYQDVLVTNNVSRNMANDDYVLDSNVTESSNIGTVVTA